MPIPFVINHIAPPPVGTPGTFDVNVSWYDHTFQTISEGEILEGVAPGRIRVEVTNFQGWATDDKRMLYIETDMGERYPLESHNDPDVPPPNVLRRPGGSITGLYPGTICGHAMRGTDMSGNQLLTPTYTGGPGPTGTIDQTVEVYVSDGISSDTRTFTVRLMHGDLYYRDRAKTFAPLARENTRLGILYVSDDPLDDFSWAQPEVAQTATDGGVFHVIADSEGYVGGLSQATTRSGPWGNISNNDPAFQIYLKAGSTFLLTPGDSGMEVGGYNAVMRTAFHGGVNGDQRAKLDCTLRNRWCASPQNGAFRSNANDYRGWKLVDLEIAQSDYDVSDVTWREWWNIINITGLSGTIDENTTTGLSDQRATDSPGYDPTRSYNGELLTDGAGKYVQVIRQNGNELICRHVGTNLAGETVQDYERDTVIGVGETDFKGGPVNTGFADGATLTGLNNGATMTFVAAGSRQDRTRRSPGAAVAWANTKGVLVDNVLIYGASVGLNNMGQGLVVSDTVVKRCWNYSVQQTGGVVDASWSTSGLVMLQPLGYNGGTRWFPGTTVSNNRNAFNVIDPNTNIEVENNISHAARRWHYIDKCSCHRELGRWFGGHSQVENAGHQPFNRFATSGAQGEYSTHFQVWGCGWMGGNTQVQFATPGETGDPWTPDHIRVENCHFVSDVCTTSSQPINSQFTNFVVRNCIIDASNIDNSVLDFVSLNTSGAEVGPDPDVNWVEPIVEFCTFQLYPVTPAIQPREIRGPYRSFVRRSRTLTIAYRNNVFAFDPAVAVTYSGDGLITQGEVDDLSDFTVDLRPTVGATNAYQTATPPIWGTAAYGGQANGDFNGTPRPTTGASKGVLEP